MTSETGVLGALVFLLLGIPRHLTTWLLLWGGGILVNKPITQVGKQRLVRLNNRSKIIC